MRYTLFGTFMRYVSIPLAFTALIAREMGDYITKTIKPSPLGEFGLHEMGFSMHVYSVIVMGMILFGVARIFHQYFLRLDQTKFVIEALGGQEGVDAGLEKKAQKWLEASDNNDVPAMDQIKKSFHMIVDWVRQLDYKATQFSSYIDKVKTA